MGTVNLLLQERHKYYRALLAIEVIVLISLSSLQREPRLIGLLYLLLSGVGVVLDSPLLPQNRLQRNIFYWVSGRTRNRLERIMVRRQVIVAGWLFCLISEVVWQTALRFNPPLAVQLSPAHLVVWLALMLYLVWSLVNALIEEPVFTGSVLMGAAAGYLMVGFAGGIALNSLLVVDPAAFQLPAAAASQPDGIAHAPTMLGAAFACLTTLGSPVLRMDHLTAVTAGVAIAAVGQLYIAILIAGVLGKPRKLAAARRALGQRRARSSSERRSGSAGVRP